MRMRAELRGMLAKVEGQLRRSRPRTGGGPVRPVRDVALDILEEFGWPAFTREVGAYARARYGREILPTRFGPLMSDEAKSFHRRDGAKSQPRAARLCYALTWNRAEPIKRLLARSDWPLEHRIVAPTTGRVQYLKMTQRFCELAFAVGKDAADPEMLRILAADHARDLLGVEFKRGQFPLEEWAQRARKLLAEVESRDLEQRRRAAEHWAKLDEAHQLFGLPEEISGVDGVVRGAVG
jgi:hypothetical protein